MKRKEQVIIIVGAGAAGLMAAKRLSKKSKVIVLEASDRIGGRINTVSIPGFSRPIEAGAEFIHGRLPVTLKLLKKAKIDYRELEGNFYRVNENGFQQQQEMIEGWDKLLKQMKKEKRDMTLEEFMQKHYPGDDCREFRKHISNYAEGFDVADPSKASMKALYNEWSNEDQQVYRITGGYKQLIDYLAEECSKNDTSIITNSVVSQIIHDDSKVTVRTRNGDEHSGDKCIVTVPVPFLQNGAESIRLQPAAFDFNKAAGEIGFGTVVKVVIEFNEPFWNAYVPDIGFIISDEAIPTWWTQLPDTIPILTGWKGGPGAEKFGRRPDDQILDAAFASLSAIFKLPAAELQRKVVATHVFNWLEEKYSRGAYSYAYTSSKGAKKFLNQPIDKRIFFAGEALLVKESAGTVESALISGKEVASRVRSNK